MEDNKSFENSKDVDEKAEKLDAQFYCAYCYSEDKRLSNWNSDYQVAVNAKEHHKRNNPNHSVGIKSK